MKNVQHMLTSALFTFMVGCGVYEAPSGDAGAKAKAADKAPDKAGDQALPPMAPTGVPDQHSALPPLESPSIKIDGSIASAFAVTVDGHQYQDSEDFYSQKLVELEAEATKAGYAGYQLSFNAQLGLDDLKNDMTVYVQAQGGQGYAGQTQVQQDGTFEIEFPNKASGAVYDVKANKRIGVVLTSDDGSKVVTWCFNFAGIDSIKETDQTKPIILNKFKTTLTRYACEGQTGGITIPGSQPAKANIVLGAKVPATVPAASTEPAKPAATTDTPTDPAVKA